MRMLRALGSRRVRRKRRPRREGGRDSLWGRKLPTRWIRGHKIVLRPCSYFCIAIGSLATKELVELRFRVVVGTKAAKDVESVLQLGSWGSDLLEGSSVVLCMHR